MCMGYTLVSKVYLIAVNLLQKKWEMPEEHKGNRKPNGLSSSVAGLDSVTHYARADAEERKRTAFTHFLQSVLEMTKS